VRARVVERISRGMSEIVNPSIAPPREPATRARLLGGRAHTASRLSAAKMTDRARSRAVAAFLVLAAAVGVAARGGSSSSNAQTSAHAHGRGGFSSREVAVRGCLEKHGVLPVSRDLFGAGDTLASRIRQSRNFTALVMSCGVGSAHSPSFVEVLLPPKTLIKYLDSWTACVARNGYKLPPPNTSGEGPAFPSALTGSASIGQPRPTACRSSVRRSAP
jgi:hypothetical protein